MIPPNLLRHLYHIVMPIVSIHLIPSIVLSLLLRSVYVITVAKEKISPPPRAVVLKLGFAVLLGPRSNFRGTARGMSNQARWLYFLIFYWIPLFFYILTT